MFKTKIRGQLTVFISVIAQLRKCLSLRSSAQLWDKMDMWLCIWVTHFMLLLQFFSKLKYTGINLVLHAVCIQKFWPFVDLWNCNYKYLVNNQPATTKQNWMHPTSLTWSAEKKSTFKVITIFCISTFHQALLPLINCNTASYQDIH